MRNSELIRYLDARFAAIDERLNALGARIDGLHTRLDTVIDAVAELRRDFATHTHED